MNNITQLHNVSPEKFKTEILDGVKELISEYLDKSNSPDKLLTRKEIAKFLSISLPTLRSYVKRGLIKEHRVGARVLYKKSEIIDSIANTNSRK